MNAHPHTAPASAPTPLQHLLAEHLARIERDPNDSLAWRNAARTMAEMGQIGDAVAAQEQALGLCPALADAWVELGIYKTRQGVKEEPESCFRQALRLNPDHLDARTRLGHRLLRSADLDGAGRAFAQVLTKAPDHASAVAGAALVLDRRGQIDSAWDLLTKATCTPTTELAAATATVARHVGQPQGALPIVKRCRRDAPRGDRALLLHAEGDLYDAAGDHERAWRAWSLANRDRALAFDVEAHQRSIQGIVARTSTLPDATGPRSDRPVFVVGMPRSGTTLVESILAAHPSVHGAGELEAIRELAVALPRHVGRGRTYFDVLDALPAWAPAVGKAYLDHLKTIAPPSALRVVDKMPNNALHIALIASCLPGAHIVWCVRDDDDVALSCFRQALGAGLPWATSLAGIRAWQQGLHDLHAHWTTLAPRQIHTLRYEDLVADPEGEVRRLTAHIGLPYDGRLLDFHRSGRAVATASWDQVREPIHGRNVGSSSPYRDFLR